MQRLSTDTAKIGPGKQVTLHIAVSLEDGTDVLSSFGDEPMRVRIGDGTLSPGIESLLADLEPGADEQMLADGAALFGARDAALVHRVPRSDFPEGFVPEPGQVIAFEAPGGQETTGTILSVHDTEVEIDFNHPLAHRRLRIHAQVLEVS
jgi:FKBP-type peptidyl-prolyl cis-trans isomerase SlpA